MTIKGLFKILFVYINCTKGFHHGISKQYILFSGQTDTPFHFLFLVSPPLTFNSFWWISLYLDTICLFSLPSCLPYPTIPHLQLYCISHTHTHILYRGENMWYLSFWIWLILLNIFACRRHDFILVSGWIILHCVCILHFLYPFTCWREPRQSS
jgi:hypothetical protein